jgi:hypothetical protein
LREQCTLEQQAKQHLEEELRAELEEKQHIIAALNTKVSHYYILMTVLRIRGVLSRIPDPDP